MILLNKLCCLWMSLQAWDPNKKYFPSFTRKEGDTSYKEQGMLSFPLHQRQTNSLSCSHILCLSLYGLPIYMHLGFAKLVICCWFSIKFRLPLALSIMASRVPRPLASFLLFLNLIMYIIVAMIAGWAINYGIDETPHAVLSLSIPTRLFPIYYPIGNLATGFFVIFSLITGVVGIATSVTGLQDVLMWTSASLLSASASSFITWALTLLAMGLACKEISISRSPPKLRTLETLTIILSGTQLLCTGAINAGATSTMRPDHLTGRV
ncbi:membrane protein PM19L-like [Phoenix dactylifera]|uniref:Membrane protein PM19L-like n=1 Tax=Phoenix dactylifera TaxID=42345 RepID=A0A8B7D488_PHODC|nr:membrane protein PM19L-like [Phoenix dactylifera]